MDAQTIGVLITAASVTVAAIYYVINLRETTRNRRATLANNIAQNLYSDAGVRRWIDLATMSWKDNNDFLQKYDHRVNLDNYVNRASFWNTCEVLGYQYRSGLIDLESLDAICGVYILGGWMKFKPLIEEYRKNGDYPEDRYKNWEYLAGELTKYQEQKKIGSSRDTEKMLAAAKVRRVEDILSKWESDKEEADGSSVAGEP